MANLIIKTKKTELSAPLRWLKEGAHDMNDNPKITIFYGLLFSTLATLGWMWLVEYIRVMEIAIPLMATAVLVLGPITALSLYEVSKQRHLGNSVTIGSTIKASFGAKLKAPYILISLILIVLSITWVKLTPLFYAIFNMGSLQFVDPSISIIQNVITDAIGGKNLPFIFAYMGTAVILGITSFFISFMSYPMILDKNIDPFTSMLYSIRCGLQNLPVFMVWGAIVVFILMSTLIINIWVFLATLMLTIPLISYSTWHAYQDLIDIEEENLSLTK